MLACQFGGDRLGSLIVSTAAMLFAASSSLAMPITVVSGDESTCDVLSVPSLVDELGTTTAFPTDEFIGSASLGKTTPAPCKATDITTGPDEKVRITNLTGRAFSAVWYVADASTTITNVDGKVNNALAFQIDAVGVNRPLISESVGVNGVFEPGETWEFVLQDYTHTLGLPPHRFGSIGVPSNVTGDDSTGSIIAIEVPEPRALLLLGAGMVGLVFQGRMQRRDR